MKTLFKCEFPDTTVQFTFREAGNPELLVKSPYCQMLKMLTM